MLLHNGRIGTEKRKQIKAGEGTRYDGRCRTLTEEEKQAFRAAGRIPVIRFRAEMEGETTVEDIIRGQRAFYEYGSG